MVQKLRTENKNGHGKKPALKKKKWAIRSAAAVMFATALTACSPKAEAGESETSVAVSQGQEEEQGQDIVIPVKEISDTAKFYPVSVDGTQIEVLAVLSPDGTIRTAFNTCQVCYDSGKGYYKQDGDTLVCQNCGNRFPMSRVEVEAGGCNPWPIFDKDKTVTDESITISYDFLKESKKIFANWKTSY